jgi:linoleoyl-CoA desaturase
MKTVGIEHRYQIHDKLYDLTGFVHIHPGGDDMFRHLKPCTDITPMIYQYHRNPKEILKIVQKYEVRAESNTLIEYGTNYTYDRYCDLKRHVYDYMQAKSIPVQWSTTEILSNVLKLLLMASTYVFVAGTNASGRSYWWIVVLAVMNLGIAGHIFHETAHYCGFKNQTLNKMFANSVIAHIIPATDWQYDHNYLHHCFTNSDYDDDFGKARSLLRYSKKHTHYMHHRLQFIYVYLVFFIGGFTEGPVRAVANRRWNIALVLMVVYFFGCLRAIMLYGLTGIMFLGIAQVSHIQHECIPSTGAQTSDFLYNQVSKTMNFRTDDIVTRFLCFNMDIQIEHHLFPNLPHSSLRKIQHIVREYCNMNDIPYIEKANIGTMIFSYLCYLYHIGNP